VTPATPAPPEALVTFTLAGTRYAFAVADVVEVTAVVPVTPVPGTAARLVGVTAWRGRTIPVLDPRRNLKREGPEPDVLSRILVVGRPSPFGVLMDAPGRVLRPADLRPIQSGEPAEGRGSVPKLASAADGLVRLLDPEAVLGDVRTLVKERR
jgi:chemotaxis signal transduction protein